MADNILRLVLFIGTIFITISAGYWISRDARHWLEDHDPLYQFQKEEPKAHGYTLKQWRIDLIIQESCRHSRLGSCLQACPECKVYGFFGMHDEGARYYKLCKYCGIGQDVGGEPFKCYVEACPICFSDEKMQEALDVAPEERKEHSKMYNTSGKYEDGLRITQSPGHACPKDGTIMRTSELVDKWHKASLQVIKDEVYEIHQY